MAGLSYSRLRMRDSADYYLRLAADSALAKNIEWYAHHFARNYADFLYDFNPKASISYLRLLEERYPERETPGSYVMPWINLGELDSARKYIEKNTLGLELSHSDDIASHALNYAYQFILGVKENKPVDISRLGQYCDSLYTVKSQTEKAERERLVDQNRLRRENLRLEMSRQRTFSILVIVSLLSILVAGGVFLYIRNRRNRLIDMEERLEALRQLLNESKQSVAEEEKPDSAFFRKVLLQQLGVIRLMATTPTQQNKELLQQMTRITNEDVPVDTLLVWDDLYPIIDAVYDNFHTHLVRLSDGRLLEKEIQLCCLLCAGFSTKEISVVTQQSVRTIYQRKTDIRHKLGMDEKEDIIGNISAQTANINFSL
ncbi:helix-turn-helix transcriptional regulator [Parabacteroides distasonis]